MHLSTAFAPTGVAATVSLGISFVAPGARATESQVAQADAQRPRVNLVAGASAVFMTTPRSNSHHAIGGNVSLGFARRRFEAGLATYRRFAWTPSTAFSAGISGAWRLNGPVSLTLDLDAMFYRYQAEAPTVSEPRGDGIRWYGDSELAVLLRGALGMRVEVP